MLHSRIHSKLHIYGKYINILRAYCILNEALISYFHVFKIEYIQTNKNSIKSDNKNIDDFDVVESKVGTVGSTDDELSLVEFFKIEHEFSINNGIAFDSKKVKTSFGFVYLLRNIRSV